MKKLSVFLLGALPLAACGVSLEKHLNQVMAHYIQHVHVACEADEDCAGVLLSCRYPQWGYAAVNRRELSDLNRIREADWYTRCDETPDTSHVKTWCDAGRCKLVEDDRI